MAGSWQGGAPMKMHPYLGRTVEIVYWDRQGRWTQRVIVPLAVTDEWVRAYCRTRKAPRLFRLDRIMAVRPLQKNA